MLDANTPLKSSTTARRVNTLSKPHQNQPKRFKQSGMISVKDCLTGMDAGNETGKKSGMDHPESTSQTNYDEGKKAPFEMISESQISDDEIDILVAELHAESMQASLEKQMLAAEDERDSAADWGQWLERTAGIQADWYSDGAEKIWNEYAPFERAPGKSKQVDVVSVKDRPAGLDLTNEDEIDFLVTELHAESMHTSFEKQIQALEDERNSVADWAQWFERTAGIQAEWYIDGAKKMWDDYAPVESAPDMFKQQALMDRDESPRKNNYEDEPKAPSFKMISVDEIDILVAELYTESMEALIEQQILAMKDERNSTADWLQWFERSAGIRADWYSDGAEKMWNEYAHIESAPDNDVYFAELHSLELHEDAFVRILEQQSSDEELNSWVEWFETVGVELSFESLGIFRENGYQSDNLEALKMYIMCTAYGLLNLIDAIVMALLCILWSNKSQKKAKQE